MREDLAWIVLYADKIIRTGTDANTGDEIEQAIPFMKGYTVFDVEQIEGLPEPRPDAQLGQKETLAAKLGRRSPESIGCARLFQK